MCLGLWLDPLAARARTIEAAWRTSVDSNGFTFEPVGDAIGGLTSGHLFPSLVLDQAAVGASVSVPEAGAVALLGLGVALGSGCG